MKNVYKLLGVIAMMLILGLTLVGCDEEECTVGGCVIMTDAYANVSMRVTCLMPDCNTTKVTDNQLRPNMFINCNCDS